MRMTKPLTLVQRIKLGCANAGIVSDSDLSRRMGINRQTVNRWTTGKGDKIQPEMLVKLADALNVSLRWLATGTGEMAKEARLTHQEIEILALWKSLPSAARDHWLSQGRDLASLLGKNGANNPFSPSRK